MPVNHHTSHTSVPLYVAPDGVQNFAEINSQLLRSELGRKVSTEAASWVTSPTVQYAAEGPHRAKHEADKRICYVAVLKDKGGGWLLGPELVARNVDTFGSYRWNHVCHTATSCEKHLRIRLWSEVYLGNGHRYDCFHTSPRHWCGHNLFTGNTLYSILSNLQSAKVIGQSL